MKTRTMWIYVAVSVVLVASYVITGNMQRNTQITLQEAKKLFEFEKTEVVRLSIDTAKEEAFEATRVDATNWTMSAPYTHVPANYRVWEELARVVTLLTNEAVIEEAPEDLAVYGLEEPPLKVVIETEAKELIQLNIGDLDATQNNRYTQRIGEDTVFLMPAKLAEFLYRSLKDVRDTRVFPDIDGLNVTKIKYTRHPVDDLTDAVENSEGLELTFAKTDQGHWEYDAPIQARAYAPHLIALLNKVLELQGDDYTDNPDLLEDYGLSPAWAEVTITDGATNQDRTLRLGWIDEMADDGRMFASLVGSSSVFTVDASLMSVLPDAQNDFRERRLYTKDKVNNLASIHYKDAKSDFTLELDPREGWTLTNPAHPDTDQATVNAYIALMVGLKGSKVVEPDEMPGLKTENIVLSYEFSDGSPSTNIALGTMVPDSDPPMLYARQDIGGVVTIPMQAYQFIQANDFTFRNKNIFRFEPKAVTEVDMQLEGTRYVLKRELGAWTVVEPAGHQVQNASELDALLTAFNNYAALNVVDPVPSDEVTGVTSPVLDLKVTYVTPSGFETIGPLKVDNLISEQSRFRFSWVEGREETFFVDHGYIEDIRRGILGISPGE